MKKVALVLMTLFVFILIPRGVFSELNVYISVNKPAPVLSVRNPEITLREEVGVGEVILNVTNKGEAGEIEIHKKSGDLFEVYTKRIMLSENKSTLVPISVSPTRSRYMKGELVIEACGVTPEIYLGKCSNVSVTIEYIPWYMECKEVGHISCSGNRSYVCTEREDGLKIKTLLKECSSDEVCLDTRGCVKKEEIEREERVNRLSGGAFLFTILITPILIVGYNALKDRKYKGGE